jgi:hypothetical protein
VLERSFYTLGDSGCIYIKHQIPNDITGQFAATIATPDRLATSGILGLTFPTLPSLGTSPGTSSWERISLKYWLGATRFSRLVGPREFHWISSITCSALYKQREPFFLPGIDQPLEPVKRILLLGVDISWKANVKADGRFHDVELVSIALASESFNLATPDLLQKWT